MLALLHFKIVRTDSAAVFFGLLSLWRILKASEKSSFRNQVLAGSLIGLSIASRYFMVALIPILLLTDGLAIQQATSKKSILIAASAGLLAIFLAFIVTTPYFFLDFSTAMDDLHVEARTEHVGADGLSHAGNLGWYLATAIPATITWPQFCFVVAGCCIAIWKRRSVVFLMVGYVFIFLIAISLSALHWSRWVIPILPVLALLAAFALDTLCVQIFKTLNFQLIAQGLCVAAISVWPTYQSILYNIQVSNPSTRILARNWIVQNLSPGSHIAQERYTALLDNTDFIVTEKFSLAQNGSVDSYRSDGYDYLIVSDSIYQRFFSDPDRYPNEVSFYSTLFEKGYLLCEFKHTDMQGGPTIRIYKLKDVVFP